ncbi:hypothetical protein Q6A86_09555, partial [Aliarcobacter skirrowii]|nr:hypothetical protein [Aliarcobacter skirrowii]
NIHGKNQAINAKNLLNHNADIINQFVMKYFKSNEKIIDMISKQLHKLPLNKEIETPKVLKKAISANKALSNKNSKFL